MGCYERVCPISTLPIWPGDSGVLIIWDEPRIFSYPVDEHGVDFKEYTIEPPLWGHTDVSDSLNWAVTIQKGIVDFYGWLENVPQKGWIKDSNFSDYDYRENSTLISGEIWDWCQTIQPYDDIWEEHYKNRDEEWLRIAKIELDMFSGVPYDKKDSLDRKHRCIQGLIDQNCPIFEAMHVIDVLSGLGKSWSGASYLGQQFSNNDLHIKVLEKSLEIARRNQRCNV